MARDSNGNYTSPSGNFVSGTIIDSGVMNAKLQDIGSEITNSLDRNGKGGMLARLRGVDGTSALPAFAFSAETTLGIYRAGTADLRVGNNGTDLFRFNSAEIRAYVAMKISTGGLTVDAGGLTVTAGGGTITAGGLAVTAGGLTVGAGGAAVTGTLPAVSGVAGASSFTASGTMSTTNGESHALTTLAKATSAGPNGLQLNARSKNTAAVTSWDQVDVGLSYDVDNTVGSGGSLYFGKAGAKLTGATTATATDPANALELVNGNLKLSGTAPNKDEAIANTLTPINIPKALASISMAVAGTPVLEWGLNVASVAMDGVVDDQVNITFAQAFADADEIVVTANSQYLVTTTAVTTTGASFKVYEPGSATQVDLDTVSGLRLNVTVFGRQA